MVIFPLLIIKKNAELSMMPLTEYALSPALFLFMNARKKLFLAFPFLLGLTRNERFIGEIFVGMKLLSFYILSKECQILKTILCKIRAFYGLE